MGTSNTKSSSRMAMFVVRIRVSVIRRSFCASCLLLCNHSRLLVHLPACTSSFLQCFECIVAISEWSVNRRYSRENSVRECIILKGVSAVYLRGLRNHSTEGVKPSLFLALNPQPRSMSECTTGIWPHALALHIGTLS